MVNGSMMNDYQAQHQSAAQIDNVSLRPQHQTEYGKKCYFCGAAISSTAEICIHCGRPQNPNVCTFCGTILDPDDRFCSECGNSREGIVCPACNTLNFRSFCRKCNTPLDDMAREEVEKAKKDPLFQKMTSLAEHLSKLEQQLLESADQVEDIDEHALSDDDKQLLERYKQLLQGISSDNSQPSNDNPTRQPATKDDNDNAATPPPPAQQKQSIKLNVKTMKELKEEYERSAEEINRLMEQMMPPAGSTPQMQRNYFCARKVPVYRQIKTTTLQPIAWVCNLCGCHHSQPSECAQPQLGGKWIYQKVENITIEKSYEYED